jgi:hypothetical protein
MIGRGPLPGDATIEELLPSDRDSFNALYRLYETVFPMPDEREPPEAFGQILAMNQNLEIQQKYGPYREIVALVRLWLGGPVVGGHIFGVTTSADHLAAGYQASVQAIYTFLHKDYRGILPMGHFIDYCRAKASETYPCRIAGIAPPIIFFEVNNPLRMTVEEIETDTRQSGLDPHRRYNFWLRCGFRPLALPFVQSRLRPDAKPVPCLDLFCSASAGRSISSKLVLSHLRSFVSISVLKDQDAAEDPEFRVTEQYLLAHETVALRSVDDPDIAKIVGRARAIVAASRT